MKVKIESDGTLPGTTIKTLDGQDVGPVTRAVIQLNWADAEEPTAILEVIEADVNMVCEAELIAEINGKRYKLAELEP